MPGKSAYLKKSKVQFSTQRLSNDDNYTHIQQTQCNNIYQKVPYFLVYINCDT